jgi:hypothetical protein
MEAEESKVLRKAEEEDEIEYGATAAATAGVRRTTGSMSALSGGQGVSYLEFSTGGKKQRKG